MASFLGPVEDIKNLLKEGDVKGLLSRYGDIVLAGLVVLIVGMMIIPLPPPLLDILITLNITIAVTLLLISLYIPDATKLASFPSILLITTLFRLALNVSSTRLILLHAYAGEVIKSFGQFVVAGNYVVGGVVFLILTIIQFIVIAKGAERVAEVAARFTLDAMPGKQMSIDADLRAGAFDLAEARRKRVALQRESQLYGSMDGAMKFVKGDAIAGIIITLINIIGGLIIGIVQKGMTAAEAAQTYSLLTIGDGLVSQIPALIISVTAGMIVTRVSSEEENSHLAQDIGSQLIAQPKAFAITSGILFLLGLIPGLPTIPFFVMSAFMGTLSYLLLKTMKKGEEVKRRKEEEKKKEEEEKREEVFTHVVPLVLELSRDISDYLRSDKSILEKFLNEHLKRLKVAMFYEMGIRYPGVQVKLDGCPGGGRFRILLKEVPTYEGELDLNKILVNDTVENLSIYGMEPERATNPVTGKPAAWVKKEYIERLKQAGIIYWDTPEIIVLYLSWFMKKYAAEFLDLQEVQTLLDLLSEGFPALVKEVVPKIVSLPVLTEILQRLVQEGISIKDLRTILQALSEFGRGEKDVVMLTEYVRGALKRYITYKFAEGKNMLMVYLLDPEIEEIISSSIQRTATGNYLSIDPETTQKILESIRAEIGNLPPTAQNPVILTDMEIRRYVKRLTEMDFPNLSVISYQELSPDINVHPLARIMLKQD